MNCATKHLYEFGPFRLEPAERLLLRDGQPVALMPKAFDTLLVLVQHSGHLVKKDELLKEVWNGAIVEEGSLARCISVLRKALGEDPKDHKYIETVPGHGYRFVALVAEKWEEDIAPDVATSITAPIEEHAEPNAAASSAAPIAERRQRRMTWPRTLGLVIAIVLILLGLISARSHFPNEGHESQSPSLKLKQQGMKLLSSDVTGAVKPVFSPDGKLVLYVAEGALYVVPIAGGDVSQVAGKIGALGDLPVFTTDGNEVVFSRYRDGKDGSRLLDLWTVPTLGGTHRRFIAEASGAHFSPDGKWVAYTKHFPDKKPLWISPLDRLEEQREVSALGFTPRWSPDGQWIAYTTSNPNGGDGLLWVVSPSLAERRQLTKEPQQMYGLTWSADSRSLIFAAGTIQNFHLFQVSVAGGSVKPLTAGVGDYSSPSVAPDGKTLTFCHGSRASDLVVAEGIGNPKVENITQGEAHLWPRLCPAGNSVISVVQRPDFNEHLYSTDSKTRERVQLSDRVAHHPCWLGEDDLAYLSFDASGQQTEVRVVNRVTGVNSSWTQFPGEANWLAVHPDRKRLAVVLKSPEGRQKVVLREMEKQADLTLAEGAEYEALRWLPDGSALSWSGPQKSGGAASNGVWTVEPGQGQPRRLVPDGYGPIWSADGASVYFFRFPPSLWQLDVPRNVLTKVRDWDWGMHGYYDLVGKRLVFTQGSSRSQIYSVPLSQ